MVRAFVVTLLLLVISHAAAHIVLDVPLIPNLVPPPECYDLPSVLSMVAALRHRHRAWNTSDLRHCALLPGLDLESPHCSVRRVPLAEVSRSRFEFEFLEREPVIFTAPANRTALFQELSERGVLLHCFSNHEITLSTANQHSYAKTVTRFSEYVARFMGPQDANATGADTKYHFGDNKHVEWDHFFQYYTRPTSLLYHAQWSSLSFGLAGCGTGVPFHTHGHVFAEVLHGKKRWFLARPNDPPRFESDMSVLRWLADVFPTYTDAERSRVLDCTVSPGEILYIPTRWFHSTLNLGEAVFMSEFV